MKVLHLLEALLTTDHKQIKVSEQELIAIIELCLDNLQWSKSITKVYKRVKRDYELEK